MDIPGHTHDSNKLLDSDIMTSELSVSAKQPNLTEMEESSITSLLKCQSFDDDDDNYDEKDHESDDESLQFVFNDVIPHQDFLQLSRQNIQNSMDNMSRARNRLDKLAKKKCEARPIVGQKLVNAGKTSAKIPSDKGTNVEPTNEKDVEPNKPTPVKLCMVSRPTSSVKPDDELGAVTTPDELNEEEYKPNKTGWRVDMSRTHNKPRSPRTQIDFKQRARSMRTLESRYHQSMLSSADIYNRKTSEKRKLRRWHSSSQIDEFILALPYIGERDYAHRCHRFARNHDIYFLRTSYENIGPFVTQNVWRNPDQNIWSRHDDHDRFRCHSLPPSPSLPRQGPSLSSSTSSLQNINQTSSAFDPVNLHYDSLFRLVRRSMTSLSMKPNVPTPSHESKPSAELK